MNYKQVKHIFFDLDRTLWDFKTNSREVLTEIVLDFGLKKKGVRSSADFIETYERINEQMWDAYRKGNLSKEKLRYGRFAEVLRLFGINELGLSETIGAYYIKHSPYKVGLFDHTHEILSHLKESYVLHIITNGFEEVQHLKLKESHLLDYFTTIITSEAAKAKKPDPIIFEYAQQLAGGTSQECLIIGDDLEADIQGGIDAGWQTIHFDPHREHANNSKIVRIEHLKELEKML